MGISRVARWPSRSAQPSVSVAPAMAVSSCRRMIASARARSAGVASTSCSRMGSPGARPISARMASKSSSESARVPSRSKITAGTSGPSSEAHSEASGAPPERATSSVLILSASIPRARLVIDWQQLVERRRLALDEAQRVDARDDEAAQIGAVEAARLEGGHRRGRPPRRGEQQRRARSRRTGSASREPAGQPAVGLAQDRMVGAARQPPALLVGEAQRRPAPAPRTPARSRSPLSPPRAAARSRYMRTHARAPSRAGCAPSRC